MQALQELNIKPKYWKDLLTDEPFTRKDIIHLQVPPLTLHVLHGLSASENAVNRMNSKQLHFLVEPPKLCSKLQLTAGP